jgi:hypothetical protein
MIIEYKIETKFNSLLCDWNYWVSLDGEVLHRGTSALFLGEQGAIREAKRWIKKSLKPKPTYSIRETIYRVKVKDD